MSFINSVPQEEAQSFFGPGQMDTGLLPQRPVCTMWKREHEYVLSCQACKVGLHGLCKRVASPRALDCRIRARRHQGRGECPLLIDRLKAHHSILNLLSLTDSRKKGHHRPRSRSVLPYVYNLSTREAEAGGLLSLQTSMRHVG